MQSYKTTVLKIRTLNNVSIPLPLDESDVESPITDSDDAVEGSSVTPSFNCTSESPATSDFDPNNPEVESPVSKSSVIDIQKSPMIFNECTAKTKDNRRPMAKE